MRIGHSIMTDSRTCPKCSAEVPKDQILCPKCNQKFGYSNRELSHEEAAFEIEFECRNCGNDWSHKFAEGDRVFDHSQHRNTHRTRGIEITVNEGNYGLWCPVCDQDNQIYSTDRTPVK